MHRRRLSAAGLMSPWQDETMHIAWMRGLFCGVTELGGCTMVQARSTKSRPLYPRIECPAECPGSTTHAANTIILAHSFLYPTIKRQIIGSVLTG